jgi:hypothetical protein
VRRYFDQGRIADATALAKRCASAYSHHGLLTMGNLLYWQGRYNESLAFYKRCEERYNAPNVVVQWWLDYRSLTNDTRYDPEIEKRIRTLFPRGEESVTLRSFQNPPDEGVLIAEENDLIRAAGLKKGDVIVALNGRRVYDMRQYAYVRVQLKDPAMHFISWNGREYIERSASPPNHRFGVGFGSYKRNP